MNVLVVVLRFTILVNVSMVNVTEYCIQPLWCFFF